MDGWNLDEFDDLVSVMEDIYDTDYEIKHCVRGCNTSCHTYAELAEHLNELADRLNCAADYLSTKSEDSEDDY